MSQRPGARAALAVLLSACAEPTIPSRSAFYAFDDGGAVFHWPAERLPVRLFADPRGNMRPLVALAIATWEDELLYGELRGVLVDDSSRADVIARWSGSVPADVPPDPGLPVRACSGATTNAAVVFADSSDNVLYVDLRIESASLWSASQIAACMRRVAVHEMGHALGILTHSAETADVMNATPTVAGPSVRDRNTVQVLYHTTATIRPPPRP